MDENYESELYMYDVECDNINDMLQKKLDDVKQNVPVSAINDQKYRELRSIILQQKKIIKQQADQIKLIQSTSN
jgi:hypothetical protein